MDEPILRHAFKLALCVAAVFMVFFWHLVRKDALKRPARLLFDGALIALAALSVFAYFEFGWKRFDMYMNPHDVYHYYIGAKYSKEHGYFDMYRAVLVADRELGARYKERTIRNLETHHSESTSAVLRNAAQLKAQFTPERWQEFLKDVAYFRGKVPNWKWNHMLRDKGYNATPVWNAVARFLANRVPTDSEWGMRFLTYIDPILLACMFGLVGAAFGWRAMLFAVAFCGLNYFMSFVHIKGAFMRLDWVALVVMALCLVRLGWYKTAGGFAAYAFMARVFPLIFAFGLGVKLLMNGGRFVLDRYRKVAAPAPLDLRYIGFFASFAVVSVVLVLGTAAADGGFHLWNNFFEKIAVHNSDISTTRAGFKYIFVHGVIDKATYYAEHQTTWRIIMAAVILLTAFLMRKARDYETFALGFIPVFFLAAPTFYYYVMLIIPLFLFLPAVGVPERTFGAAGMFALSGGMYALGFFFDHHFQFFYYVSWTLLVLCAYQAFCAIIARPEAVGAFLPAERAAPEGGAAEPRLDWARLRPFLVGLGLALLLGAVALGGVRWLTQETAGRKAEDEAELVFVGDIMLSRNVARTMGRLGKDFTFPFQGVADVTQRADLAFGNLESPISGRGQKIDKKYTFNAPRHSVEGLTYAGFDVVSLANNHILDYGTIAMDDTVRIAEGNGIRQVGLTTGDEPQNPLILKANGVHVGFLAYCDPAPKYSYAEEFYAFDRRPAAGTRENLARDIGALRDRVDILVVSMHWGIEYQTEPTAHSVALGRFIIDQGADILAGHHPHVQQEPEVYKGGLIIYSMGNFVFDQHSRPLTRISRVYRVYVNRAGVTRAEYLPCEIPKGLWQPRPTASAFVPVMNASRVAARAE